VVEALTTRQATVGGPYFKQTTIPLFLLLLFLMGVGPLLPWRRATPDQARRRLTLPASAFAVVVVGLAVAGMRNLAALIAFGMAAFVGVANGEEIVRGIRAFARATHSSLPSAARGVFARNRRMYGGYVVHLGVAIAVVAITASSSFARQTEVTLSRGQQVSFAGYLLRYEDERALQQPQREVLIADVAVSRGGRSLGRVTPSLNLYPAASEPIGTPSIKYGVFKDLYSSVLGFQGEGDRATFRFFLNPGVMWLWVGGGIMAIGGLLAAWPNRRRPPLQAPRPRALEHEVAAAP